MIREATKIDLEQLVKIHCDNFDKNELSMILGKEFIYIFYEQLLVDDNVLIKVVEIDNEIKALSILFFKYSITSKLLSQKMITKVFLRIIYLSIRLDFKKIIQIIKSSKSKKIDGFIPNQGYDYHLGVIIIDEFARKDIKVLKEFKKMYQENCKLLMEKSNGTFWGSTRESNINMIKILKKTENYKEGILINSYPENNILHIFEK